MDYLKLHIEDLTGISLDVITAGLAALVLILIIIMIINGVKMRKLKKRYEAFMSGKNAASLEDTLVKRLNQVDDLIASDEDTKRKVQMVLDHLDNTYQKVGLVKYDAFNEMGGKLSFSLALLNRKNDGFIINAMHSREGCYTYVKEIVKGESYVELAEEEAEALDKAIFEDGYEEEVDKAVASATGSLKSVKSGPAKNGNQKSANARNTKQTSGKANNGKILNARTSNVRPDMARPEKTRNER